MIYLQYLALICNCSHASVAPIDARARHYSVVVGVGEYKCLAQLEKGADCENYAEGVCKSGVCSRILKSVGRVGSDFFFKCT